jgi:bifunctional non-homologous end joining protein LigD
LLSRRKKPFNKQDPGIVESLTDLPDGTVLDGEVVGLDDEGHPNFNLLQHSAANKSRIFYFVFDLLVCENCDLMKLRLRSGANC